MRKIFVLESPDFSENIRHWAEELAERFGHEVDFVSESLTQEELAEKLAAEDCSMLLIELIERRGVQKYLNLCRELRMPYIFVPKESKCDLRKIYLPITFLVEDKEKIPFASAMGRFVGSEITIYQPKDYGDKAKETIGQAKTLFNSFSLNYTIKQGKKDSFGVEREATQNATDEGVGMVIISASREYGLDDIIFGSKEKKILRSANVPIMLINPRADLYALCD